MKKKNNFRAIIILTLLSIIFDYQISDGQKKLEIKKKDFQDTLIVCGYIVGITLNEPRNIDRQISFYFLPQSNAQLIENLNFITIDSNIFCQSTKINIINTFF